MKLSSRLRWDSPPNAIAKALAARRRAGAEILDLTESNPTAAGFSYPAQAILEALADPAALRYEPAPAGLEQARDAVVEYYARRGFRAGRERILLTASTSEAYAYLFKLLTDPGDEVLVPRPSYPLFEYLGAMERVKTAPYPLAYHDGWFVDFDVLEAAVTPATRAIVVVNPNNPTGSFLKRGELERLHRLCRERALSLISDEVFADYAFGEDPERVATLADNRETPAFSMSGLSKAAGLPQMKLGWIVLSGPEREQARAAAALEWIADTYLSVSTPVQRAAASLLRVGEQVQHQIKARTAGNLAALTEAVRGTSLTALGVEGGWYATLRVPGVLSEEEWVTTLLEKDGLLVQPGYFYDFGSEAFLVLSLLTEPALFEEGVRRLIRRGGR
jgi:aspartate/methionine/tyrosine aminotransferase